MNPKIGHVGEPVDLCSQTGVLERTKGHFYFFVSDLVVFGELFPGQSSH